MLRRRDGRRMRTGHERRPSAGNPNDAVAAREVRWLPRRGRIAERNVEHSRRVCDRAADLGERLRRDHPERERRRLRPVRRTDGDGRLCNRRSRDRYRGGGSRRGRRRDHGRRGRSRDRLRRRGHRGRGRLRDRGRNRCGRGDRRRRSRCRRGSRYRRRSRRGRCHRRRGCGRRGCGRRRGRRCWCRHGRGRREHGQEGERIEIALFVRRVADAEMHVRRVELRRAARADRADGAAFVDCHVLLDPDRTEVRQGDREAGRGQDRERLPARGHRPGEADDACRGRDHRRTGSRADRDATVLARRVRMRRIEGERLQDRPLHRPRPRARSRNAEEEEESHERATPTSKPHCRHRLCCLGWKQRWRR